MPHPALCLVKVMRKTEWGEVYGDSILGIGLDSKNYSVKWTYSAGREK